MRTYYGVVRVYINVANVILPDEIRRLNKSEDAACSKFVKLFKDTTSSTDCRIRKEVLCYLKRLENTLWVNDVGLSNMFEEAITRINEGYSAVSCYNHYDRISNIIFDIYTDEDIVDMTVRLD